MNYETKYSKLVELLKTLTIEHGYCTDQFLLMVRLGVEAEKSLADEIFKAFADEEVSWQKLLNNNIVGEVYESENEDEAKAFAKTHLLEPAKSAAS